MTKIYQYKDELMTVRRARQIIGKMQSGETIKAIELKNEKDEKTHEEDKIEGVLQ